MADIKNPLPKPWQVWNSIGYRLFVLKKLLIKSDEVFCEELGIHPQLQRSLELGLVILSAELCQKIQEVYRVNKEWLLKGKGFALACKGPKTQWLSYRIDSMLDYRDPFFIQAISLVMDPDNTDQEIDDFIKKQLSYEGKSGDEGIKAGTINPETWAKGQL